MVVLDLNMQCPHCGKDTDIKKHQKKPWYSYCIVWIDKNKEQINDVVDDYSSDDALDIIFNDEDWDEKVSAILWMGKYPLSVGQMKEREAITGIESS